MSRHVFVCHKDNKAWLAKEAESVCPKCGDKQKQCGWIESSWPGENKEEPEEAVAKQPL